MPKILPCVILDIQKFPALLLDLPLDLPLPVVGFFPRSRQSEAVRRAGLALSFKHHLKHRTGSLGELLFCKKVLSRRPQASMHSELIILGSVGMMDFQLLIYTHLKRKK